MFTLPSFQTRTNFPQVQGCQRLKLHFAAADTVFNRRGKQLWHNHMVTATTRRCGRHKHTLEQPTIFSRVCIELDILYLMSLDQDCNDWYDTVTTKWSYICFIFWCNWLYAQIFFFFCPEIAWLVLLCVQCKICCKAIVPLFWTM